MIELAIAGSAAYGAYLLYTSVALGWSGVALGPAVAAPHTGRRWRQRLRTWMVQAGLDDVRPVEFVATVGLLGVVGAVVGLVLFAGPVPAATLGAFSAATPLASYRVRRDVRRARSQDAWPRMIEEMRLRTGALGRSIPQALFEVGARGPAELRPAFEAGHREWLLTTDFERTIGVLKERLADPTADIVCETLLVAHQLGGSDLGRRLTALADDRMLDLQGRKDARAKQAGARLARRFVVLVPLGMAIVGLQVGEGRTAYATSHGQVVVLVALTMIAACWMWAGRIMRLPDAARVFPS
ncbi:MAG: type II secretion system F family protein [Acidimicrobiales bacterium]